MRPILLTVLNFLILTMQVTFHDRLKIQISSIKLRNFSSFLHKYGLYIILLHLKQKKGMEDGCSWLLCETRNAFHTDTEVLSK